MMPAACDCAAGHGEQTNRGQGPPGHAETRGPASPATLTGAKIMATATKPTSADVRIWAVKQGLAKDSRGRLSHAAINAYNAKHKVKYS